MIGCLLQLAVPMLARTGIPPGPEDWAALIVSVTVLVLINAGVGVAAYVILTVPLRRCERARLFIRMLETALARGEPPARAVEVLSRSREGGAKWDCRSLLRRMERGQSLSEALRRSSEFIPSRLIETIAVGERTGRLDKVLPVCRQAMEGARSRTRAAVSYMILFLGGGSLTVTGVTGILGVFIVPKYQAMLKDLVGDEPLPAAFDVLAGPWIGWLMGAISIGLLLWLIGYSRGLGLTRVLHLHGLVDVLDSCLPWRRARRLCDFSSMLSILLDAGVPEDEALSLAAQSTASWTMRVRTAQALRELERGVPLPEAVGRIDSRGELRWRLANGAHGPDGFRKALAGWHAALAARADQLEQAGAHLLSTGILLLNAAVVGVICVSVFQILIGFIDRMAPW